VLDVFIADTSSRGCINLTLGLGVSGIDTLSSGCINLTLGLEVFIIDTLQRMYKSDT